MLVIVVGEYSGFVYSNNWIGVNMYKSLYFIAKEINANIV